jgi:hypothetical protein
MICSGASKQLTKNRVLGRSCCQDHSQRRSLTFTNYLWTFWRGFYSRGGHRFRRVAYQLLMKVGNPFFTGKVTQRQSACGSKQFLGNPIYHYFKVVSENFAGMISRAEEILTIHQPGLWHDISTL